MPAVLINGDHVKTLKAKLQLFNSATIGSGALDPSSSAVLGVAGDVYISTSTFKIYQKQDSGTSTNWVQIADALLLGAFDNSPNANAATISGSTLTLQPASASFPGGVSTTTQTFAGAKTFNSPPVFNGIGEGASTFAINGTGSLSQIWTSTLAGTPDYHIDMVDINAANTFVNWRFGSNLITNGHFEIIPSTLAAGTIFSTPALSITGSNGNVSASGAFSASNFSGSSSGTNTGDQTITLTGGVTGSGTGSFAATVITNANLTGPITSVGNATSVASQTGTGSTFVMNTSPTLITPNLGTPTVLVGTNITGTASGLTAGTVTTNANLTGDVTSVGNVTTVAKIQGTTVSGTTGSGNVVFSSSPVLVTPNLGTPSTLVGTNITGTASGFTAGTVTTNANLTGDVTSVGNATTLASSISGAKTFTTSLTSPAFISSTVNPADAGTLRLAKTDLIEWRNNANTGNSTIDLDASDRVRFSNNVNINGNALRNVGNLTSNTANPSTTGTIQLASTDSVAWRNNANSADLLLAKNTADSLTWNGNAFITSAGALTATNFSGSSSGTNTGDQTITLTGDVTGSGTGSFATTVAKIAGTTVSGTTGTTNVVFSNSPTLVTPNLGTPSTLVGTNITGTASGLTAGTVTTNANLTGDVTSVGNTTTVAKIQGTTVSGTTGTVNVVFSNSPTLVTPNLGTPSTLVGTNITGTAAGLTAGTVTTNANLTGDVTSVGNTTTVAKIQGTTVSGTTGTGNVVFSTSPTLTTPALGTPSALVGTNITGTAAGLTAGTVTTNANLTGDITSVGNATTAAATQANIATLSRTAGVAVHGTNTNDDAAAGFVGQFMEAHVTFGGRVTLTATNTPTTVTSFTLTPGDWDIAATIGFDGAVTTSFQELYISTADNATTGSLTYDGSQINNSITSISDDIYLVTAGVRRSIASSTTYYLVANAGYTGTMKAYGSIRARRMR